MKKSYGLILVIFLFPFSFFFAPLSAQIITTIGGNGVAGYSGDAGPATAAEINIPCKVAVDSAGNVYFADNSNHRVRKISTSGNITTAVGNGVWGYSGDGGPATAAELAKPMGLCFDKNWNLYVTDQNDGLVRKINTSGIISTFAGRGANSFGGDGGPATAAYINQPAGVAADQSGNIYIADYANFCVRKVNTSGIITTIAGTRYINYSGDGGPATAAAMGYPSDVATDAYGNIYINDVYFDVVRKINGSGIISTYAGDGIGGFSGDGFPAVDGQMNSNEAICMDKIGNMYIADFNNYRIRKVGVNGEMFTIAGTGVLGFSGDGGPATAAELSGAYGVATDEYGNIYFSDYSNERIRKINIALSDTLTQTASSNCANCNGTASITVEGGLPAYTYIWTPGGQTTATITGMCPGLDTVLVVDSKKDTIKKKDIIIRSTIIHDSTYEHCAECCNCQGIAAISPYGGTAPYTFLWSNGGTTDSIKGLSSATYVATVTDANGCTAVDTVFVTKGFSMTVTSTNIKCYGSSSGSASVTFPSGTQYTYLWSPGGQTSASIGGLSVGTYVVLMADTVTHCTASKSVSITEPPKINVFIYNATNQCATFQTITSNVSGGTPPYTYTWITGHNFGNYDQVNLQCPFTYYYDDGLTVTDSNGCTAYSNLIYFNYPVQLENVIVNNESCNGGNNGSLTIYACGGFSPSYTYTLTPGGTYSGTSPFTITGLTAQSYTVEVGSGGCTAYDYYITITQPPALVVNASVIQNILCYGGNNGSASSSVSGGTAPYTYSWSPSGGSNINATGLTSGTYTLNVTDNNGCHGASVITITQPASQLTISVPGYFYTCNSNQVLATANTSGGTPGYTYNWLPFSGNTSSTLVNDWSGCNNNNVIVTDANGCTATASYTVYGLQPPFVSTTYTNVTCGGGDNGAAEVLYVGCGQGPFGYSWAPSGGTNATATGLSAGTYTVTITDNGAEAFGCQVQKMVNITAPPVISVTTTVTAASCSTGGTTSASASNGVLPYTYAWSNGKTTTNITGLSAGTYTINVTDHNGCTGSASATITQANGITVLANVTSNVSCYGGSTGSASSTVTGGTGPYTYSWSNSQTTPDISGLSIGTYTLNVSDNGGCTGTTTVNITQPNTLQDSTKQIASNICLCKKTIIVFPYGGTKPYSYLWSNSITTDTNWNVQGGQTYSVTITDSNGCTYIDSVKVAILSFTVITNQTNIKCNGGGNIGTASVTFPLGNNFHYSWAPGGQTTVGITGLSAGSYTVTVVDSLPNCKVSAVVNITQPPVLHDSSYSLSNVCNLNPTLGTTVTGGTPPYTYSWSSGGTDAIENYSLYCPTLARECLTVTDNNGCIGNTYCENFNIPIQFAAPFPTQTNVSCYGGNTGTITVNVCSQSSSNYFTINPGGTYSGNFSYTFNNLTAGTYTISVSDLYHTCSATYTAFTITQPNALTVSANTTSNVLCNGGNTGSASSSVNGGTTPYTYSWSNSQNTPNISGLSIGTYTLNVTDNNGCTGSSIATITQPPAISVTATVTPATCNNLGSATAITSGGVLPYTYTWSNSGTNVTDLNLSAGTYTINVTDNNGCMGSATIVISQASGITVSANIAADINCNGGNNGSASSSVNGGSTPYTYSWSNSQTTPDISNLSAGTYTLNVADNNGCIGSAIVNITQPAMLSVIANVTANVGCGGINNGSASASPGGGTMPYTYSWSDANSQSTPNAIWLSAGSYTVTVTDSCGASATGSVIISQPPAMIITTDSASDNGSCNGAAWVSVGGGKSPYTYLWTGGNTTDSIGSQCHGYYCCNITDANGCVDSVCINVILFTTTGNSISPSGEISVYPNPNNGEFTISLGHPELVSGPQTIEIYNVLGEKVYSDYQISNSQFTIDLRSKSEGIYFYRVLNNDGKLVGQGKIVVEK